MGACFCDYDSPGFYVDTTRKARKSHKCYECGCEIQPGEEYEEVRAAWDGKPETMRTCPDCLAIRNALSDMECFCWSHGGLWEDIRNQLHEAFFTPGEKFIYLRIIANHRRRKRHSESHD